MRIGFGTIACGILRNKNMLPDTGCGKAADFLQNGTLISGAVVAANERNGAESAAVGAAFTDADIGRIERCGENTLMLKENMRIFGGNIALTSLKNLLNGLRELFILIDAQKNIDLRNV